MKNPLCGSCAQLVAIKGVTYINSSQTELKATVDENTNLGQENVIVRDEVDLEVERLEDLEEKSKGNVNKTM